MFYQQEVCNLQLFLFHRMTHSTFILPSLPKLLIITLPCLTSHGISLCLNYSMSFLICSLDLPHQLPQLVSKAMAQLDHDH